MRIRGINIPDNKHLDIALTAVYGIGRVSARKILENVKISFDSLAKDVSQDKEKKIRELTEKYMTEGDLKKEISENVKRLKDIKSYRGIRHMRSLPVRGQQTKTNSRTRRGNVRATMASGKRKAEKK